MTYESQYSIPETLLELISAEGLEVARVHGQARCEVAFARARCHDTIAIEVLEFLLLHAQRFDAAQGQAAALNGVQTKATLIHRPQFERQISVLPACQLLRQAGAERCYGSLVFI